MLGGAVAAVSAASCTDLVVADKSSVTVRVTGTGWGRFNTAALVTAGALTTGCELAFVVGRAGAGTRRIGATPVYAGCSCTTTRLVAVCVGAAAVGTDRCRVDALSVDARGLFGTRRDVALCVDGA